MTDRPPRDDLALMEGYHSPQVDVDVRLNTNEAPEPPPAGVRARRCAEAVAAVEWHRYPDRAATAAARGASPRHHGVDPEQVFAANGSNEVLQTLCLAYGGAGRTVGGVRADLRAAQPHRPHHRHRGGRRRAAPRTSPSTSTRCGASSPRRTPAITFLCSPNNPTGMVDDEATVRAVLDLAPGLRRRRRGLRPVRPVVGARAGRRRPPARRHPHLLEDVVDGGGPPRLPRRPAVARRRARQGRAAVPPRRGQAGRRPARPRLRRRDARPGRRRWSRSGAGSSPRLAELPVDVWPSARQLRAVPARRAATATRCGRRCSTGRCSCATARRGLASTAACGSPSAPPTRTTRSSPPSRRSSHDPVGVQGAHHQGDEHLRAARPRRPDRHGRGVDRACRSSTTCSTSSAATAASTSTCEADGRPRGRRPPHGRGRRHPARRGVPRGAGRQGRRPPLRQRPATRSTRRWSRSPSTCRAGRSSCTTCPSARCCRSATRRSTRRWPSTSGSRSPPPPASRCTCSCSEGRNTHHIVEATFKGVARCLRDAVRVEGTRRPVHQGRRCDAVTADRGPRLRHRQPALGPEGARSTSAPTPASPPTPA